MFSDEKQGVGGGAQERRRRKQSHYGEDVKFYLMRILHTVMHQHVIESAKKN